MIKRTPKRPRRGKSAGLGPGAAGRGTQRKQPIAKGQKPGRGVRRGA
ncbi:MAG: hypothetical protein ACKOJI_10880 [Phycisphaerales bacterium]